MLPSMNIELRPFKIDDAVTVADLVGDEDVSKWTANIPFPYSKQDAIDWISFTNSDDNRNPFAVELNGKLVACVSYWPHQPSGIEVGYWVGKQYWGNGICTKALKLLLASKHFPANENVFAKVMAQNIGSQRVLEKCGFSFLKNGTISKGGKELDAKYYVQYTAT